MLCIGTALFGMFFFLTLFMQTVLGYSPIRTGIAYLPFAIGIVVSSALASQLVARIGARPTIPAGSAMVAGGTFWFTRLTERASYAGHLLGPILLISFGLGLVFVPLSLVALHNVAEQDSRVASSMPNVGQQVGGAIGLALLGTVAWTAVADSLRTEPPSPRQSDLAGSASRHVITTCQRRLLDPTSQLPPRRHSQLRNALCR
jgi:predicted MFS family arabinose efflux permease